MGLFSRFRARRSEVDLSLDQIDSIASAFSLRDDVRGAFRNEIRELLLSVRENAISGVPYEESISSGLVDAAIHRATIRSAFSDEGAAAQRFDAIRAIQTTVWDSIAQAHEDVFASECAKNVVEHDFRMG